MTGRQARIVVAALVIGSIVAGIITALAMVGGWLGTSVVPEYILPAVFTPGAPAAATAVAASESIGVVCFGFGAFFALVACAALAFAVVVAVVNWESITSSA